MKCWKNKNQAQAQESSSSSKWKRSKKARNKDTFKGMVLNQVKDGVRPTTPSHCVYGKVKGKAKLENDAWYQSSLTNSESSQKKSDGEIKHE